MLLETLRLAEKQARPGGERPAGERPLARWPEGRGRAGGATARWLYSTNLAERHRRRHPDGYLVVRFEDLVAFNALYRPGALDAGMVESNPVMRWTTDHPVAFVSMKAAATATTILVAEKIRKKYPWRAALFMAGVNTAYALIVSHNYRATAR